MTFDGLLLDGVWLPATETVAFFETGAQECVDSFMTWRGKATLERTGIPLTTERVEGDLESLLGRLLPLVTGTISRYLFVPTAAPGWTALLLNRTAPDLTSELLAFAVRGIRGVKVTDVPHLVSRLNPYGSYGERKIEVAYEDASERHGFMGHSLGVRATSVSRWEYVEPITGLPFPDPTDHGARRVRDMIRHEHLVQAAGWFGLRPFDADFYAPDGWGLLVESAEPREPEWEEFTLAEARVLRGIDPR